LLPPVPTTVFASSVPIFATGGGDSKSIKFSDRNGPVGKKYPV
jgi:hypothetical protein